MQLITDEMNDKGNNNYMEKDGRTGIDNYTDGWNDEDPMKDRE